MAERLGVLRRVLSVREGEWGGHFYLVGSGSLDVSAAGHHIRTLHAGDPFVHERLEGDGARTPS